MRLEAACGPVEVLKDTVMLEGWLVGHVAPPMPATVARPGRTRRDDLG